jgi:endonuclease YncB( thermonuclease family)
MYKIKSLEGLELFAKEGVVETERLLTKLKSNLPYSKELKGKVVSIADGDTVIIVVADNSTKSKFLQPPNSQPSSKKQYRIRLNDIDAPESKQAFGNKSKENLKNYIYQKDVVVKHESTDKYGRILGTIYYQGKDINLQQVKDGYAWVYRHYSKKQDYIKEEEKARQERKGLWADKNPINPYDFRRKYK